MLAYNKAEELFRKYLMGGKRDSELESGIRTELDRQNLSLDEEFNPDMEFALAVHNLGISFLRQNKSERSSEYITFAKVIRKKEKVKFTLKNKKFKRRNLNKEDFERSLIKTEVSNSKVGLRNTYVYYYTAHNYSNDPFKILIERSVSKPLLTITIRHSEYKDSEQDGYQEEFSLEAPESLLLDPTAFGFFIANVLDNDASELNEYVEDDLDIFKKNITESRDEEEEEEYDDDVDEDD